MADQVNRLGQLDAVIHNAGVYGDIGRHPGPVGHPRVLTINTLAPYLLTELIQRPNRLIYLTSDMHVSGDNSLHDLTWSSRRWDGTQAYCDSKLFVTALALAVARRWPDVISHAVDPGWVPTRMGGPGASDDLDQGHLTQTWLATSDDPDALRSGQVWKHRRPTAVATAAQDPSFRTDSSTSWPTSPAISRNHGTLVRPAKRSTVRPPRERGRPARRRRRRCRTPGSRRLHTYRGRK